MQQMNLRLWIDGRGWAIPVLVAATLIFCSGGQAQEARGSPAAGAPVTVAYANDVDGLRGLLESIMAAAREGDDAKLQAAIKELEIPNYASWFVATVGREKGESLAATYGPQLEEHEAHLTDLMKRMVHRKAAISAEKVDPKTLYDTVTGPLDVYLADWVVEMPSGRRTPHIGYFYFIDGKFRWDSNYVFAHRFGAGGEVRPGQTAATAQPDARRINSAAAPGSYPKCTYCPNPPYTDDSLKAKFQGVVMLSVMVQADGTATDVKVTKSSGFASLDQKSVETVMQWQFRPAVDRDGNPVPYLTQVECSFHTYGKN